MGNVDFCWFTDGSGDIVLRYTLNGGCTWKTVGWCADSVIPSEPIIEPVAPIDQPGEIPDPYADENTKCAIVQTAFRNLVDPANEIAGGAHTFIISVIGLWETPSAVPAALLNWMKGAANNLGGGYADYYPAFKALTEEHIVFAESIMDGEATFGWGGVVECMMFDCVPVNGVITRSVMNCIADALDEYGQTQDANDSKYWHFLADFVRIFPLAWIRNAVFENSLGGAHDCSACEPAPGSCPDVWVTFDAGGSSYTVHTGNSVPGRNGLGLKNILVSNGWEGYVADPGYQIYGLKIEIPFGGTCQVDGFEYRANSQTEPHLNANNLGFGIVWKLQIYNGATLTHEQECWDIGLYYYDTIASGFIGWGRSFIDAPITGDRAVLTLHHGASGGYIIHTVIDEIIVSFVGD